MSDYSPCQHQLNCWVFVGTLVWLKKHAELLLSDVSLYVDPLFINIYIPQGSISNSTMHAFLTIGGTLRLSDPKMQVLNLS
jgi:hypothetical protein